MLIKDIVENQGGWRNNLRAFGRGFGQGLARRYVPDIDFTKRSAQQAAAVPQPAVTRPTAPVTAQTPVTPTTTAQTPVTPTTTAQTPVTPTTTAQTPVTTVTPTTTAPSQPAATKPRVLAQPIRVGNKVYRPGDPMHARLSQMMQAQQQT